MNIFLKLIVRICLFITFTLILSSGPDISGFFPNSTCPDPGQSPTVAYAYQKGADPSSPFLEKLSKLAPENIGSIKLVYKVSFHREWNIRLEMTATVEMERVHDGYVSTFHLTKPVGSDLWGKIAMFVYGRHTNEYKKMVDTIGSKIIEKFSVKNGNFVTSSIIEVLPERLRIDGNKGFKILFDHDTYKVFFWENKDIKNSYTTIAYEDQVGPLTAFFNYLLFKSPETEFRVVNLQKQAGYASRKNKKPKPIGSQSIIVGRNNSGEHSGYRYAVFFLTDNFFDIVYGKHIFYDLVIMSGTNLKLPNSIFVKGIINKRKNREKTKEILKLKKRNLPSEQYEEKFKSINSVDVLSARNVKVSLVDALVNH